jgi:hypothetical protein
MPTVYCDHNFILAAHDSPASYQTALRAASQRIELVLSTWHWLEMARDRNHARGISVADFADSLNPLWLHERLSLHRREVRIRFMVATGIPFSVPPPIATIDDVVADLTGMRSQRPMTSAGFVEHMRDLGADHELEQALRNNFYAQEQNRERYRTGVLADWQFPAMDRYTVRRLLPERTDAGYPIETATREHFLWNLNIALFPSISLEKAVARDGWKNNRVLTDRAFRDYQHIISLPYVDYFVTDDAQLARIIRRVLPNLAFDSAKIVSKAEFDGLFL